ncbi:MAG: CbiX/SirB N-terminal domain-containing protein [Coriobacteriia bacterium]|nr:CbiX/SirB N-terminal domain-containing protein [Coriobacteriia bacterium]
MDPGTAWWIALVGGALLAGASVTAVLVAPRRTEALFAVLGALVAAAALTSFAAIVGTTPRVNVALYAFTFLLAFAGGGYALASTLLLSSVRPPAPAQATETANEDPRPAVIICRCVEPESYAFSSTASMLDGLASEGLLEPSVGTLPLLFFAQKARYRLAGGASQGVRDLSTVAARLQDSMREVNPSVTWATCSGAARLAVRVSQAVSAGHRRIVVVDLSVAPGIHFERAVAEADAVCASAPHTSIVHTTCMRDADSVLRHLANRILAACKGEADSGVVLVGIGQPRERATLDPRFGERETSFLNRLKMILRDEGMSGDHVRIAWSEWEEPDVTQEVRHLAALGCTRIRVVPATRPIESLATSSDLRAAIRASRLDESAEVMIMPAWGSESPVVGAIADSVRRALRDDQ